MQIGKRDQSVKATRSVTSPTILMETPSWNIYSPGITITLNCKLGHDISHDIINVVYFLNIQHEKNAKS